MLSAPFPPPFWLLKLCKLVNAEGTIRLCAQYDSLQLAVKLAIGEFSSLVDFVNSFALFNVVF